MKAIDFATRLMAECLNNPTSLIENAIRFSLAAGLDHKNDIARTLRITASPIVTALRRLAKRGYVESHTWDDEGTPLYRLTPGGKAYLTNFFNFNQH